MAALWPEILVWLPFALALGLGWAGRSGASVPFLALTAVLAMGFGIATPGAVAICAACLSCAALFPRLPARLRPFGHALLILVCLAFGLGAIPGIGKLAVLTDVQTGPGSVPFSFALGLEKPFGVFVLLFALPGVFAPAGRIEPRFLGLAGVLLAAVFALALGLGVIRPELSLPVWLPLFALANLLLTCLPEEAFFRACLQRGLAARLGDGPAIAICAGLFGLGHFGGGPGLVLLAALAGVAYGLAYRFGGGLRAAVACHFGFNLVHLVLFTYPAAA